MTLVPLSSLSILFCFKFIYKVIFNNHNFMHITVKNLLAIQNNIKDHLKALNIKSHSKIIAVSKTFKIDKNSTTYRIRSSKFWRKQGSRGCRKMDRNKKNKFRNEITYDWKTTN